MVCTPNHQGGLGLRALEQENVVSGAKMWWRWFTHNQEPREKVWHIKYAEEWDTGNIIQFPEDTQGLTYGEQVGWEGC